MNVEWEYLLTSLGRAKVFARSGGTGSSTASLLDAQSSAFYDLALETVLGSVGFLRSDHLDESKTSRLLGVGVSHDLTLLDLAVLFKDSSNFLFSKLGVNASDKEVRAGVDSGVIVIAAAAATTTTSVAAVIILDAAKWRVRRLFRGRIQIV